MCQRLFEFGQATESGGERIYYVILAAGGLLLFCLNLRRSSPWLVLGTATVACLVVGFSDLIAHDLFNLYRYHPELLPGRSRDDHLGLVLAELLFVPGLLSTLATVTAQARFRLALLLAAIIVGTEALFVSVGALEYNGWRLWLSILLFPLYTTAIAWWTTLLERHGYRSILRLIVIIATGTQLVEPWANFGTAILGYWEIHPHLFAAKFPDQITGMYLLYQVPTVTIFATAVSLRWARSPWAYPAVGAALWGWFSLLDLVGALKHAARWTPGGELLILLPVMWAMASLDRYMERVAKREPVR